MRQQRLEWQRRNVRPRKLSRREASREYIEKMRCAIRRIVIPDPSALPPTNEWRITIPDPANPLLAIECIDVANTKSEVRAKLKATLGEVPNGTVIQKTGRQPRQDFINQRVNELYESRIGTAPQDQPGVAGTTEARGCDGAVARQHL